MSDETHTAVKRWGESEFPFSESQMDDLHEVLPQGYWIAEDYSADDIVKYALMKYEG